MITSGNFSDEVKPSSGPLLDAYDKHVNHHCCDSEQEEPERPQGNHQPTTKLAAWYCNVHRAHELVGLQSLDQVLVGFTDINVLLVVLRLHP